MPSHNGGSTVAGSHDPPPVNDDRNLRRKIDSNSNPWSKPPEDENSRSAVLLRFPCCQSRAGVTAWFTSANSIS